MSLKENTYNPSAYLLEEKIKKAYNSQERINITVSIFSRIGVLLFLHLTFYHANAVAATFCIVKIR